MRVRVTPIPVVPPRAVSIAPPELDRAAPLPPTRDQGWGNSRPPAPADQRAERQRRSRRVFTPSAPFNRPWMFARKPARRGSKCVASSGRPHSSRASHARREEIRKTAKHWYRPELVPAEVGFRGDFVEYSKFNPQNLGSQIKDLRVHITQHTAREKHDTYPIERLFVSTPRVGHILRVLRVSILSADDFFLRLSKIGTFFVTRSAHPPDPRVRRRYLSVIPSRSARST